METPDSREEQGGGGRESATCHENEMDGDKASALDVYLRFKLSPRSCAAGEKEVLSFADFSLGLS